MVMCLVWFAVLFVPASSSLTGKSAPARPLVGATWTRSRDVRRSLKDVLDAEFGKSTTRITDVRIDKLSSQLKPLFEALPKNGKGLLGHATVRYALHRHFVHQHGMYVKGLEPGGEAWNQSSPIDIMEDKVPSYVQHLFEERLHDGFDLHELALLAATLEHFVHQEAKHRLEVAYHLSGNEAGLDGALDRKVFKNVLSAYMAIFISGDLHHRLTPEQMTKILQDTPELFPTWKETMEWLLSVERDIYEQEVGTGSDGVTFGVALKVVEAVVERYGQHQNQECREMTKTLVKKERRGTGRLRLADFYRSGWEFTENKDFLHQLGALDSMYRPADGPWVVIPNYVVSLTNCLASSTIYSVCCMDQCEDILRQLESKIGAPSAEPKDLVKLVASLPSASVHAPRKLSAALVSHLDEIATSNGGSVPLHGRLFAQWLHHAYPHECVYPIVSGTFQPLSAADWMRVPTNPSPSISQEEMSLLLMEDEAVHVKDLADGDMEETLPWDAREELVFHHNKPSLMHELQVLFRGMAFFGAFYALTTVLVQLIRTCVSGTASRPKAII